MWLGAEGEMVNAFSDVYAADKAFGGKNADYYNHLADELALTVTSNTVFKGIFERGVYCSNHNFNDTALAGFISKNATWIGSLNRFGFQWDSPGNTLVNFASQTSVLDGLDAQVGGSFAMCQGRPPGGVSPGRAPPPGGRVRCALRRGRARTCCPARP
jgi:hypothetical protein